MELYDDRLASLRKRIRILSRQIDRRGKGAPMLAEWKEAIVARMWLRMDMAKIKPCLWTLFLRLFGVR